MKYYNAIVPGELVEKLYNAGYSNFATFNIENNKVAHIEETYATIFDGLMEKDISIEIEPEQILGGWLCAIERISEREIFTGSAPFSTWHEAANAAIEKAIEILKEKGAEESAPRK